LTPTITDTPSVTDTATVTPTPFIPPAIEALFESDITPNPGAVFSQLDFTLNCSNFNEYTSATIFQAPVEYMCGVFTYDQMTPNSQWTALWWRDGDLVHFETIPWDGEVGGYGFTEWDAPASEFLPGTYEVQIFVGLDYKVVGQFLLQGDAPTPIPTETLTPTQTLPPG
jgi:type VI secretion system secreted protein VgrG